MSYVAQRNAYDKDSTLQVIKEILENGDEILQVGVDADNSTSCFVKLEFLDRARFA